MGAVVFSLSFASFSRASSCPDLTAMRSQRVLTNFTPNALTGFWYEQAFADIAQVGASCPTLNSTKGTNDVVSMALKVKYGPIPFTLTEVYTPKGDPGIYNKNAKMPGGSCSIWQQWWWTYSQTTWFYSRVSTCRLPTSLKWSLLHGNASQILQLFLQSLPLHIHLVFHFKIRV